jgi:hypothetical protein
MAIKMTGKRKRLTEDLRARGPIEQLRMKSETNTIDHRQNNSKETVAFVTRFHAALFDGILTCPATGQEWLPIPPD